MASNIGAVGAKAKDIAVADLNSARILARDAAKSKAYFYPLKGIYFFAMNRPLWKPVQQHFVSTFTIAVSVIVFMFVFTYIPQAAIMSLVNGPMAIVSTIALVLSESSTITNSLTRKLYINESLIDTFDETMVIKKMTLLVAKDRTVKGGRLGERLKKQFGNYTWSRIIRHFMYLPLYMIPFAGTFIYIYVQGKKFGPEAHARYFQLKKLSKEDKEEWVDREAPAYTSFGIVATVLEMIPFVGVFFAFTNVTGAALWAVDLEKDHAIERHRQKAS